MISLIELAENLVKFAEEVLSEDIASEYNIDLDLDAGEFLVNYLKDRPELLESFKTLYPDEYMYAKRGFIFPDGSLLDIGYYEDHRIVNVNLWEDLGVVTYSLNSDLWIRVNGYLTNAQKDVILSMLEERNHLVIDFYDGMSLVLSEDIPSYEVNVYLLESLYRKAYEE